MLQLGPSLLVPSLEVGVPAAVAAVVPGHVHSMLGPQSEHHSELEDREQQGEQEAANTQLEILSVYHCPFCLLSALKCFTI